MRKYTQLTHIQRYQISALLKIGHSNIWEGRINQQSRFTFHYESMQETGETICVFRNVDNHDEYLKSP